ncbi:MAG: S8 family serine peptidase [Coriobacteriales bacterium]|nr:S8 family serine peptidase [Coriobacteriales bacterium]
MKKGIRSAIRGGLLAFMGAFVVLGLLFANAPTSGRPDQVVRKANVAPTKNGDPQSTESPRPGTSPQQTGDVPNTKNDVVALEEPQEPTDSVEKDQADNDAWEGEDVVNVDGAEDEYVSEGSATLELPEGVEFEPQVVLLQVDSLSSADEVNAVLSSVEGVSAPCVTQEQVAEGLVRVELDPSTSMEEAMSELEASGVARSVQPNYVYRASDLLDGEVDADEQADADDAIVIGEEIAPEQDLPAQGEEPDAQPEAFVPIEVLDEWDDQEGDQNADSPADEAAVDVLVESDAAQEEINDARSVEQWALGSMQAYEAWALAKANRAVTVAVIDVGFDASHTDLAKNIVAPYNSYYKTTGKSDLVSSVASDNRHGTHVAGIVSAVANNKSGVAGISYNARVMPICASSKSGMVTSASLYHAFERAVSVAKTYNVRVINISLGSTLVSLETTLGDIIQKASSAGIVVVSSAGNLDESEGLSKAYAHYPSDIDGAVGVINLERQGGSVRKSSSSNYNCNGYDNKNICAPGTDILSTVPGSYAYMSGTSMAAPHVAGVLALQFAANPALGAEEAIEILYATATDLGASGWDTAYGWGEASAYHAVLGAIQGIDATQAAMVRNQAAGRVAAKNETAFNCAAYRAYVQGTGWQAWRRKGKAAGSANKTKAMTAIRIKLQGPPYEGGVEYRTYTQSSGWKAWKSNGQTSGATGKAEPVEAMRIRLTGRMAKKYDIWYRVRSESLGTLGWAKNGARAGTATFSKGILSFEVRILPKGSAAPGSTKKAYVTRLVRYRTYMQGYGKQSWVYDGKTSGKTGKGKRIEAVSVRLSDPWYGGGIQYSAYVQGMGWKAWKSNGSVAGTQGRGLRLEAIRVRLTGQMANKYDVWYRVYAQKYGWLGWACNGAKAGTVGLSKRLEGLQIKLVKKGSGPPGSTARPFRQ